MPPPSARSPVACKEEETTLWTGTSEAHRGRRSNFSEMLGCSGFCDSLGQDGKTAGRRRLTVDRDQVVKGPRGPVLADWGDPLRDESQDWFKGPV